MSYNLSHYTFLCVTFQTIQLNTSTKLFILPHSSTTNKLVHSYQSCHFYFIELRQLTFIRQHNVVNSQTLYTIHICLCSIPLLLVIRHISASSQSPQYNLACLVFLNSHNHTIMFQMSIFTQYPIHISCILSS